MEFESLLEIVADLPLFETGLLLSGNVDPDGIRKQLSRWTSTGKLHQLRRGLYCLAPPYQKVVPHPFLVANHLLTGSYVSLQSALAHYGMIPELVAATTSVSTGRPVTYPTPYGRFVFRHVQADWFHTYRQVDLGGDQRAFVASPEKALLDLVYLQPSGDAQAYLRSLRLQALDQLDVQRFHQLAAQTRKPKLLRAAKAIQRLAEEEAGEFEAL